MTLYDDLGVSKDSPPDAVKRAYKKKASATHPDKGGSTAAFQLVQHAYDILGDEAKRRRYDETGMDTPAPDPLALARSQLTAIFLQLVEQGAPNIMRSLQQYILQGKANVKQQQEAIKAKIKKLDRAAKKLKAKTGKESFLHVALAAQKRMLDMQMQEILVQTKMGDDMLELLKDFEYEVEKQNAPMTATFQFFGPTT